MSALTSSYLELSNIEQDIKWALSELQPSVPSRKISELFGQEKLSLVEDIFLPERDGDRKELILQK